MRVLTSKNPFLYFDEIFNWFPSFEQIEKTVEKDVKSKKENDFYHIFVKVPGYKKDEIEISIENETLFVTCIKNKNDNERFWLEDEFKRSVILPNGLNKSEITAALNDGVLTIKIKYENKAKSNKIEIH